TTTLFFNGEATTAIYTLSLHDALPILEVRGFKDEMRDMISGIIQHKEWTLDNNVAVDQKGFEVEAMLEYPGTAVRASYGYLDQRSEEHTSELQSRENLVCRLLLEKKKR